MARAASLDDLVREAQATGTLAGLPDKHLIGGVACASVSGARMESFDPGTGRAFTAFAAGDSDDVELAVTAAQRALRGAWRDTSPGGLWMRHTGLDKCELESGRILLPPGLDPGDAASLNHAFTLLSERFEVHRMSHTGNVYERIFYEETDGHWWWLDYPCSTSPPCR